eukprot:2363252-Amphidinium_carterae.1
MVLLLRKQVEKVLFHDAQKRLHRVGQPGLKIYVLVSVYSAASNITGTIAMFARPESEMTL